MINQFKSRLKNELPFFMMLPAFIWQLFFFYIPLTIILMLSITKFNSSIMQGITFEHFFSVFSSIHAKILARSFVFAMSNALLCLAIAYPTAYYLARKIKKWQQFFFFLIILPFWTNILVQIYAWLFVLEHNGLVNTLLLKLGIISQPLYMLNNSWSILVVMLYCYLPFMIMPLFTALEKIDERLIESSYDLGANGWQTFFKVTLPLSWPGIKTGFFLVFVPSFGEFVIPAIIGGSKTMFVGSLISHYYVYAHNPYIGSAFTVMSSVLLIMVAVIVQWLFAKKVGLIKG